MNPLFNGLKGSGGFFGNSPMSNFMRFVNEYRKVKSNPSELGNILYNNGKITKEQFNEINRMNGDPSKIGEYLLNTGSLPQNQMNALQSEASQMQQYINNTPN